MKTFCQLLQIATVFLFFIGYTPLITAQTQISGKIISSDEPVAYANVLLINAKDSSLVTGNITDEQGKFLLENIQPGDYVLQATMIGYTDQYSEIFTMMNHQGLHTIPNIILTESTTELEEVKVVAKRALIEQKIDRMVVNVSNSITSAGNTALEVLQRSPGISVDPQNNVISMGGKNGVTVMINGKISRMPQEAVVQMLGGMSADNIDKIELIHTPPSNFDAEGDAGFINIVLLKNENEGWNGNYSLNAGYGKREKLGTSFNFNYRKNKINFFGNYSWRYNKNPQRFTFTRRFTYNNVLTETIGDSDRGNPTVYNHNAQLGLDIQLNKKTVLGGLVTWGDRNWNMDAKGDIRIFKDNNLDTRINMPLQEKNHSYNFLGNINLQHNIDKTQSINFDVDYAFFQKDNPSTYLNQYFDANDALINETELRVFNATPMDIIVGKLDYFKNIGKTKLEMGLKGTKTQFDNDVLVEDKIGEAWTPVSMFSSMANMNEYIAAAYTAVSFKAGEKTDIKAGLRYEYTNSNISTIEESNLVDRQYENLFPSLFISHQLNETNSVQFSYSRRINRPSFRQLAPFFFFTDPTSFATGNPLLQPSMTNSLKGTYIWKTLTIALQYSYTDDAIGRHQPTLDFESNSQISGAKNMVDAEFISSTISFPITVNDWWSMRTSVTGRRRIVTDEVLDQNFTIKQNALQTYLSSNFKLPNNFSAELTGFYSSPLLSGVLVTQSRTMVNFGLQKKFKSGAKLRFSVNDIFLQGNWFQNLDNPNVDFFYDVDFLLAERVFQLSYSASFGNHKVKRARKRKTGAAEEMQRTKE